MTDIEKLRAAIEKAQNNKAKGYIIDLRSNPGGLLTNAIIISDMLCCLF